MSSIRQNLEVIIEGKNRAGSAFDEVERSGERALGSRSGLAALGLGAKAAIGAAVAGVAALGAGLAQSVQTAASFQQSMAQVQAITGATGDTFQSLRTLAIDLGATTAFSASEAAQGIQFLGMAGLTTDEIMAALPATLSLAAAGALDLGTAADISSNIMSGMGLQAQDLGHVVDGLAQAARSSNTNIQQLGEGFKFVAPTASSVGLSFDEVTAALGQLGNAGLQASIGGTSLNAALREMIDPSDRAKEAAKRLGITFTDQKGNLRPLVDIIGDLERSNFTAKDSFVLFGSEGGRAINALVQQGSESLQQLTASITNSGGVAEEMARVQMNTLKGSWEELSGAAETLMITVGDALIPILKDLLDNWVTPAVRKFNDWIQAVGGLGQMFHDAVDLVAGFGETTLNIIDATFSDASFREAFLSSLGGVFSSALTLWVNYMSNLGSIVVAGAKLLWEPISFAFGLIWEPIKQAAIAGINGMAAGVVAGINALIEQINRVASVFGAQIEQIDFAPLIDEAPRTIEERWAETKENMAARFAEVTSAAKQMGQDLSRDSTQVARQADAAYAVMENQVSPRFQRVATKYKEATQDIINNSQTAGQEAGEQLAKGVETGAKRARREAEQPVLGFREGWRQFFDKEGPTLELQMFNFGNSLATSFNRSLNSATFNFLGGDFKKGWEGAWSGFQTSARQALADVITEQIRQRMLTGFADLGLGIGGSFVGGFQKKAAADIGLSLAPQGSLTAALTAGFSVAAPIAAAAFAGFVVVEVGKTLPKSLVSAFNDIFGKSDAKKQMEEHRRFVESRTAEERATEANRQEQLGANLGSTPRPEAAPQPPPAPNNTPAVIYLRDSFFDQRFSRSTLQRFGRAAIGTALSTFSGPILELREGLMDLAAGTTPDLLPFQRQGIDIVAAKGFSGVVNEPTTILAGEAGPETVNIRPLSGMRGGFDGAMGHQFHFTFHINTIDTQGTREFIEGKAKDFIVNVLRSESRRGRGILDVTGLVADPTV